MSSMFGKVIMVTGAARGIGKATASILHSRGASLALADISKDDLQTFASSLRNSKNQTVTYAGVDVSRTEEVNGWTNEVMRDFGRLDGAANIAGIIGKPSPIVDMKDEDYEKVLAVNAGGVFRCLRAQLKNLSPGGAIVNVASISGLVALPEIGSYTASKHAVIGLTKTAAKEVGHRAIRVNAVAPGSVDTNMSRSHMSTASGQKMISKGQSLKDVTPLGRIAEPEEVGRLIAWLLIDEASYINAEVVRVDGGWLG